MKNQVQISQVSRLAFTVLIGSLAPSLWMGTSAQAAEIVATTSQEVSRCSDSDGGSNLSQAGTVSTASSSYRDSCSFDVVSGLYTLKEYSCSSVGPKPMLISRSWKLEADKACQIGALVSRNVDIQIAGEGQWVATEHSAVPPFSSAHKSLSFYVPVANVGLHESGPLEATLTLIVRGPHPELEAISETWVIEVPYQRVGTLSGGEGRTLSIPVQDSLSSGLVDAIYEDALSSSGLYSLSAVVIVNPSVAPEISPLDNSVTQLDSSTSNGNLIVGR